MTRGVELTTDALQDLADIRAFLTTREGVNRAEAILTGIEKAARSLAQHAERGHHPPELASMGLDDILEIHFKPYRLIYQIEPKRVTIVIAADGRQDFRSLLTRRLLR